MNFMNHTDKMLSVVSDHLEKHDLHGKPWYLGFSGGADSSVLLDLLCKNAVKGQAITLLHVNHQLSDVAQTWVTHAENTIHFFTYAYPEINFSLCVDYVDCHHNGKGLEAAARFARYAAFESRINEEDHALFLGHHANDQLETVLFRLFRGTGAFGLKGISEHSLMNNISLYRPMLDISRQLIEEYASQVGLTYVTDPSNGESKFDRNFLRNKIVPLIYERWPHVHQSINRLVQSLKDHESILEDMAIHDLDNALLSDDNKINLTVFKNLSSARQRNMLNYWLNTKLLKNVSQGHIAYACALLSSDSSNTSKHRHIQRGNLYIVSNKNAFWLENF